ncbi:Protein sickie [Papilio xuthus]|uniref:Protein sickie n=1 Tax=Papilio xuthus TaxID=66420 RepID=A0A194PIJ7_PAPXU|nr:Protein sickie [Papilio xuthus]
MIPTCIRAPRSIQGSTDDVTRQTRSIVQIYTDWANHYLERARSRRRAGTSGGGLARDCADGLLLADVLEGVTGQKVPRAHRKPRNPQQMLPYSPPFLPLSEALFERVLKEMVHMKFVNLQVKF